MISPRVFAVRSVRRVRSVPAGATLAIVLTGLLAACSRGEEAPAETATGEAVAVTVQQARLGSLRDVITAAGTVVASSIGEQTVSAP